MNPFITHNEAFELAEAGDYRGAGERYAQALREFELAAGNPQWRALIIERARLIPRETERASEIVREFFKMVPEWLRELHFDRFCESLSSDDIEPARMHWALLVIASGLPSLAKSTNIELLRDLVCQRFQVTQERAARGGSTRTDVTKRAERILLADRENLTARTLVIEGYTVEISNALERLSSSRGNKIAAAALDRMTDGERQRLRVSMRKSVRRLRRHLFQSRGGRLDSKLMTDAYRLLCYYYVGVGDLELAIRLARRGRRIRPQDGDVRSWVRKVVQLRRRR